MSAPPSSVSGHVSAARRLLLCAALGVLVFGAAIVVAPWQVALLVGWDATGATFVAWVYLSVRGKDGRATKVLATREDGSRGAAELLLIAASLANLVGVAAALLKAAGEDGTIHTAITAVAALTVVVSWACVHTTYTLRYAHLYYSADGGMDFHDDRQPDYADFAYVALTLGMTYQVSDTDLTSRAIRATALRHAVLSYLFGTVIIAVTINTVASLLTK